MFCPKCGQPQVSDDVRFCSRCGFQLHIVTELLKTNGALAALEPKTAENLSLYRRITSRFGAKLMFFGIVLIPFAVLAGIPLDTPAFLLLPLFTFIVGLAQVIYAQIFGAPHSAGKKIEATQHQTLPSDISTDQPFDTNPLLEIRRETREFLPPPSVTDETTKLLDEREKLFEK